MPFSIASHEEVVLAFCLVALAWLGTCSHFAYLSRRDLSVYVRYGVALFGAILLVVVAWLSPRQLFMVATSATLALWIVRAVRLPAAANLLWRLAAILIGTLWCLPIWVAWVLVSMPR
ncbi:hypothetical protein [Pseudoxanthomonas sp. JBR18]|uniref:hypothetical protein n=1 Tax=Pseudoxanthomonas sp. JBR18 TaxID=2969308 RepID=UPI0023065C08|nr:hypothetical protein [Pseudoxanthomonas sp. JBR18]WCE04913.1 hypothetical protein PJ250_02680 [Pseudoxanthomonas sp. JBR18]